MFSSDKVAELKFSVRASAVATGIVAILAVAFWYAKQSLPDTVLFIAAAGAAAGAILSAFYSARILSITAASLEREEARHKKTFAFEFTSKWNDPTMFDVRDAVRLVFMIDVKSLEFNKIIKEQETNIVHFLNFLEEVAISIESDVTDPNILRDAFGGIVATTWNKLQDWVINSRRARDKPKLWIKVQALAEKWR